MDDMFSSVSDPAHRRKSLGSKLNDWVRGGSYTAEPSEHNRMLHDRERTAMLRWRMIGVFNIISGVGLAPLQILVMGLPTYVKDLPGFLQEEWRRVKTGKLYGS